MARLIQMTSRPHPIRWIAPSKGTLESAMTSIEHPLESVLDGRVFVNRKRCTSPTTVLDAGDLVEVFPATTPTSAIEILDTRPGLIAVNKPAGVSTIPDHRGCSTSLLHVVANMIDEPNPTRIHPTSRLDRDVSGVVILALNTNARAAMQGARTNNQYHRHYVALTAHAPTPPEGLQTTPIGRGPKPTVRQANAKDATESVTAYATKSQLPNMAMVAAEPQTGRTHQIRVHLAHVGAPMIGDAKYGGPKGLRLSTGRVMTIDRIALHAAWVDVELPGGDRWRVEAPIPQALTDLWRSAGGDPERWHDALLPLAIKMLSTTPEIGGTIRIERASERYGAAEWLSRSNDELAAHSGHSCAVTATGALLCWGNNQDGQVGDGTTTKPERHPAPMTWRQPTAQEQA